MDNFTFWNPTKIVFGQGTIGQVGAEARPFGRKALLVSGQGSSRRAGVYNRALAALREAGMEVIEFSGVQSNPVLAHLREGIALAKREQVEVVIAVGGGSVIDESKAIAAGAKTERDIWEFFCESVASFQAALPVVTVVTLAATGSEMNLAAVITNEATHQKFNIRNPVLFPKVSILDPTATYTVPRNYTAYGAIDAISHVLEGYFTGVDTWTPIQDRLVEGLILAIMDSAERVLATPDDYQGRATLMWAASLALNGLPVAGIGGYGFPNHMIEHSLSALYHIPHGAGLSIVMPGWMRYVSRTSPAKFAQLAERVFGIREDSPEHAAAKGIDALKGWFEKIGGPTSLSAGQIPENDIDLIAANAVMLARKWNLTDYTQAVIADVLRCCQ